MLPPVALASLTAIDVSVGVSIKVIIVVDVDVAVAPIAIAPVAAGPGAEGKSGHAPRQPHARVVAGIGIRIIGIRRRAVNDRRVI
jgi:hypothetical protein